MSDPSTDSGADGLRLGRADEMSAGKKQADEMSAGKQTATSGAGAPLRGGADEMSAGKEHVGGKET